MLLTGPLQSWGGPVPAVYERPTDTMPSLSGVVGIIANALGRFRAEPISDIASGAELAVRADRPGSLLRDFHTVGTPGRYAMASSTGKHLKHPVVTDRYYLSDAAFLVVYTPPPDGMPAVDVFEALLNPSRPLYLGRRSCPPSERVAVTVLAGEQPVEEVFSQAKLLRSTRSAQGMIPQTLSDVDYYAATDDDSEATVPVLIEMTAPAGSNPLRATVRKDVPKTFDPRRLYHLDRHVITKTLSIPVDACVGRGRKAIEALYESLGAAP